MKDTVNKRNSTATATKKLAKKNSMKEMANRFRAVRRLACYSQEEIGKIVGVSYQQVQKYESAIDRIPAVSLYMVAKALNVSVKEFFPESSLTPSNDAINNEVWVTARKLMAIKNPTIRKKISSMISSLEGM
jgi:transcriptional regulator with XRE-family HTH domain